MVRLRLFLAIFTDFAQSRGSESLPLNLQNSVYSVFLRALTNNYSSNSSCLFYNAYLKPGSLRALQCFLPANTYHN